MRHTGRERRQTGLFTEFPLLLLRIASSHSPVSSYQSRLWLDRLILMNAFCGFQLRQTLHYLSCFLSRFELAYTVRLGGEARLLFVFVPCLDCLIRELKLDPYPGFNFRLGFCFVPAVSFMGIGIDSIPFVRLSSPGTVLPVLYPGISGPCELCRQYLRELADRFSVPGDYLETGHCQVKFISTVIGT